MKKLNLKSLFKKINSSTALNRLIDADLNKNKKEEDLTPHFPEIENIKNEKEKIKVLLDHIKNINSISRPRLIEHLKTVNTLNNKVSMGIIDTLSKDTSRYKIDNESQAWILSAENNIDKIIYYNVACRKDTIDADIINITEIDTENIDTEHSILQDALAITEFYEKNNWTRYETRGVPVVSEHELLAIELYAIYQSTLSDDTNTADIYIKCLNYKDLFLCKIKDNTNEKNNIYLAFIPEINEVILKCEGAWNSNISNKTEFNFSVAETYMRISHKININPLVIRYDTTQFKVKANSKGITNNNSDQNMYPITNQVHLKSWQVKTIDLVNIQSAQSLSIKLKIGVEHVGMSQLWMFLSTLGDIKDLYGYNVNKINIIMEVNDSHTEKGYDKISITINEKNANLNMMIHSHQKAYKILLSSGVSLGYIEAK